MPDSSSISSSTSVWKERLIYLSSLHNFCLIWAHMQLLPYVNFRDFILLVRLLLVLNAFKVLIFVEHWQVLVTHTHIVTCHFFSFFRYSVLCYCFCMLLFFWLWWIILQEWHFLLMLFFMMYWIWFFIEISKIKCYLNPFLVSVYCPKCCMWL